MLTIWRENQNTKQTTQIRKCKQLNKEWHKKKQKPRQFPTKPKQKWKHTHKYSMPSRYFHILHAPDPARTRRRRIQRVCRLYWEWQPAASPAQHMGSTSEIPAGNERQGPNTVRSWWRIFHQCGSIDRSQQCLRHQTWVRMEDLQYWIYWFEWRKNISR